MFINRRLGTRVIFLGWNCESWDAKTTLNCQLVAISCFYPKYSNVTGPVHPKASEGGEQWAKISEANGPRVWDAQNFRPLKNNEHWDAGDMLIA